MEKTSENNNKNNFLKEGMQNDVSKHHKDYLGTTIPEGYFVKSKLSILEKIKEEEGTEVPKKKKIFWMHANFKYAVAASLVFILSLTIWLQSSNTSNETQVQVELLSFNDDVLINSLFVEDDELEAYAKTTLINEVVIKAELSEQKMDDLILDSMILDDSLSDGKFIETLIL
ncbi:hypothetical protein [Polaribacter septentrionalilitoris]|uniref:hypothetical protein n=1 Tax=Polaribacter septentrionalilitoris TaxID=2494657 RepID=UPI00135CEA29|nr:hypothetical protein [Polaribacter septentrionalilitoris]